MLGQNVQSLGFANLTELTRPKSAGVAVDFHVVAVRKEPELDFERMRELTTAQPKDILSSDQAVPEKE